MSVPQQYSPDGNWWWDGEKWVPATSTGPSLYTLRLTRHTGLVIAWFNTTSTHTGTYDQLRVAYRNAQTFCLLAGWWSVLSLLALNWISLYRNYSAMQQLRRLAGRNE
jgi:hypothetical protein